MKFKPLEVWILDFFFFSSQNRVVERFLPKNRCDQVVLDPIQNRVAARSALYEAALFEALLYIKNNLQVTTNLAYTDLTIKTRLSGLTNLLLQLIHKILHVFLLLSILFSLEVKLFDATFSFSQIFTGISKPTKNENKRILNV